MMKPKRLVVLLLLVGAVIVIGLITARDHCPSTLLGFTQESRDFYGLKNRAQAPLPHDFNHQVTLETMLAPGPDWDRWSSSQAATIEGYVVSVAPGPLELTNCFAPGRRDTHIHIGRQVEAPPREQVVLETTPAIEAWAATQGWDWSASTLNKSLVGRKVRFQGWLMFDKSHAEESENISPAREGNWRATAWEIHPVTRFEILE